MSYMKRAIEEIQSRGWQVDNESLKRLVEIKEKERIEKLNDCSENKPIKTKDVK